VQLVPASAECKAKLVPGAAVTVKVLAVAPVPVPAVPPPVQLSTGPAALL